MGTAPGGSPRTLPPGPHVAVVLIWCSGPGSPKAQQSKAKQAKQSKAKQSKQSKAKQGKAKQSKASYFVSFNCASGRSPDPTRRRNRNTAQCAVFWAGGRAGTQLIVLCSGGGAGRNTAHCAVFWRGAGRNTTHCAVFWRKAGRDTAQRLRPSSLISGIAHGPEITCVVIF